MMTKVLYVLLALAVIAYIAYRFVFNPVAETGTKAPEIERKLIDGTDFNISDLRGEYVLVDFWGSWCPPCRKENPMIAWLHDKYSDKGLNVLSIAVEKNDRGHARAIKKDKLSWPLHILETSKLVLSSPLARAYGVTDLPSKFLIDPKGNIILSNPTIKQIDDWLSVRLTD